MKAYGYTIEIVCANFDEWSNAYGDIYDNTEQCLKDHPGDEIIYGCHITDFPDSPDWFDTVNEAIEWLNETLKDLDNEFGGFVNLPKKYMSLDIDELTGEKADGAYSYSGPLLKKEAVLERLMEKGIDDESIRLILRNFTLHPFALDPGPEETENTAAGKPTGQHETNNCLSILEYKGEKHVQKLIENKLCEKGITREDIYFIFKEHSNRESGTCSEAFLREAMERGLSLYVAETLTSFYSISDETMAELEEEFGVDAPVTYAVIGLTENGSIDDRDTFADYGTYSYPDSAAESARTLMRLAAKGDLMTKRGEPVTQIKVYGDFWEGGREEIAIDPADGPSGNEGLPKTGIDETSLKAINALYSQGWRLEDIAQMYGTTRETIAQELTKKSFTIVGYDKDNDNYVTYGTYIIFSNAAEHARHLKQKLDKGELRRDDNGEPIDWLEIYEDWGDKNEKRVWTSY